jgi:triosephosphate isomerase
MPKKKIIIANWKMNLIEAETVLLVKELIKELGDSPEKVDVVLCPSFIPLDEVSKLLEGTNIKLGAQDIFWETRGTYTGEISPRMLQEWNCEYVIVGHSERRQNFKETDEMVNKKVIAAVENDLIPIICVGETKAERKAGKKKSVVKKQLLAALKNVKLDRAKEIIIAYEPVWVIGTGKPVKPEDAEEMHVMVRGLLDKLYTPALRDKYFRIIYGGSVDSKSASDFFKQELIDGSLVGGASLLVNEFVGIVKAAANY